MRIFHSYGSLPEGMYVVNIIFMWMLLCIHSCLVLYCAVLYCIFFCIALYCVGLDCIALSCIVLFCLALHCYVLYCIVLHCIAFHCFVVYCIVLYCTVLYCMVCFPSVTYVKLLEAQHSGHSAGLVQCHEFVAWHGRTRTKSRCSRWFHWNDEDRCGWRMLWSCDDLWWGFRLDAAHGNWMDFSHGHLMGISIGFFG